MKTPSFLRDESGAAMVEFAMVLPVLFLFVFGAIDFGRALKVYNNLAAAARDGARFGATQEPPSPATIITRTRDSFQSAMGMTLPAGNVQVETGADAIGPYVAVTISNYQYQPWTPVPADALTFNIRAQFRVEDVGP
jgi:Flp pilus assembly protein TadG